MSDGRGAHIATVFAAIEIGLFVMQTIEEAEAAGRAVTDEDTAKVYELARARHDKADADFDSAVAAYMARHGEAGA